MKKFSLNNLLIDIDRCRIESGSEIHELEPKVAAVLALLAEHQGQVVSHQEFFSRIWPDVIVDPNALQRCIAQLRRTLGDDAKRQTIIETHAKKGYRLVPPVGEAPRQTKFYKTFADWLTRPTPVLSIVIVAVVLTGIVVGSKVTTSSIAAVAIQPPAFNKMTALTSTDVTEFYSVFSPDGRYLVFARQTHGPYNHFVAMELNSKLEFQLTKKAGVLNEPAWSPDGNKLAYVAVECQDVNCLTPLRRCMRIEVIDVTAALQSPQLANAVTPCDSKRLLTPQWLNKDVLVYIDGAEQPGRVMSYNIHTKREQLLFQNPNVQPYHLSYFNKTRTLAVATKSVQTDNTTARNIYVLADTGKIQNVLPIALDNIDWKPNWNNTGDGFIWANRNELIHMDLTGLISQQSVSTFDNLSQPQFNPSGENIALTVGHYDFDIVETQWQNAQEANLFRSTARDGPAAYQPNDTGIAFISTRSGLKQLWLSNGDRLQPLTRFTDNKLGNDFAWSPNGDVIAVNYDGSIGLVTMGGNLEFINIETSVDTIYQWVDANTLLISSSINKGLALLELDKNTTTILFEQGVDWAQVNSSGEIFMLAENRSGHRKIYTLSKNTLSIFPPLNQLNHTARFIIEDNWLFALSIDKTLWAYSLTGNTLSELHQYKDTKVRFISDVDALSNKALALIRPWMKSEIALLHD